MWDKLEAAKARHRFGIYEENVDMLHLWALVCRYWVRAPMTGQPLYLDLTQVRTVMESMGRWPDHEALTAIQLMESAALPELSKS